MNKKLEWLADYREYSLETVPVENRTGMPQTEQFRSTSEIIEYKKGEIINVEMRSSDTFRDKDKGHWFTVHDAKTYRLS